MTRVQFFKDKEGDVFAFFPDLIFNLAGDKTCYAHVGQHSACSLEYVWDCAVATTDEYKDLWDELIKYGYDDMSAIIGDPIEYHREPTAFELRQGYGATHYKDFHAFIYLKKNAAIKKWLICPLDGLRYYYN